MYPLLTFATAKQRFVLANRYSLTTHAADIFGWWVSPLGRRLIPLPLLLNSENFGKTAALSLLKTVPLFSWVAQAQASFFSYSNI